MPQEYNIPAWYDPPYHLKMQRVISSLDVQFPPELSVREVLKHVREYELDGPHDSIEDILDDELVWWGDKLNIGANALFSAQPPIYRALFPSAARQSIEVFPKGPSAAEDGYMPWMLARSLSPQHLGVNRIRELALALTSSQKGVVVEVLCLISCMGGYASTAAQSSLEDYWVNYIIEPSQEL